MSAFSGGIDYDEPPEAPDSGPDEPQMLMDAADQIDTAPYTTTEYLLAKMLRVVAEKYGTSPEVEACSVSVARTLLAHQRASQLIPAYVINPVEQP